MTQDTSIEDYLAQGGILTTPFNVPARYRAELLRLMASFIDSELAGAAGLAERINDAPSLAARVQAARIVAEKFESADKILNIMAEFGADTARYVNHHPWAERLPRDADIGATRYGSDMRLSTFHYPLTGWVDAVAMSFLMGRASGIQLAEFAKISYQPLAEAFAAIAPTEAAHAKNAEKALRAIASDPENKTEAEASLTYWHPRVAASFGAAHSARFDALRTFGLRHEPNDVLLSRWGTEVSAVLNELDCSLN